MVPVMKKMPVVEVGEILQAIDETYLFNILDRFSLEQQGLIFSEFPMVKQLDLFKTVSKKRFAQIFENMPSENRADFFQHLILDQKVWSSNLYGCTNKKNRLNTGKK
jgi:magnesium transporter